MRIGVVTPVRSAREVREFAIAAEHLGFWGVGVPDTVPQLYQGAYPTITAGILATRRIRVGTFVTNVVTRHWSVHASNARALDDLDPGRFFLGISTGDGAVYSVGLKPSTWSDLETCIGILKSSMPSDVPIFIASSGPRGAEVVGRVATDALFSLGMDEIALRAAIERARHARSEAGISTELGIWTIEQVCVVPDGSDLNAVRADLRGVAYGPSRYRFASTFDEKNVPEDLQAILRERFSRYDHASHGLAGAENPNARLFEDRPEIERYLVDRALVIGSPEACAQRLQELASDVGLDGYWLSLVGSTSQPDPVAQLEPIAKALQPLMD
jgi:alkanesulfonate monooxygenase SsuD/methylene tetrahydromethanopterin reductase-like flavin-dependent oxidoreductase (luciferase family)